MTPKRAHELQLAGLNTNLRIAAVNGVSGMSANLTTITGEYLQCNRDIVETVTKRNENAFEKYLERTTKWSDQVMAFENDM
jgi:uncharacterized membrane protein YoaK (UPF0700 family)